MAKVFGESGRYANWEAIKRRHRAAVFAIISCSAISAIGGFMACFFLPRASIPALPGLGISLILLLAIVAIGHWSMKKLDALENERMHMQRGATGEALVSAILQNFPDEFYVTNNLATPFGDLDHVVVGSTGVFVLDTKNWRGVVVADGTGELLLNEKPTEKRFISGFVARMMKVEEQIDVLAPGHGSYFQFLSSPPQGWMRIGEAQARSTAFARTSFSIISFSPNRVGN